MNNAEITANAENFDLRSILTSGKQMRLGERVERFGAFLQELIENREFTCMRLILSAADREVTVLDQMTGTPRRMLMFGSNNYLGLANHPYVREHVIRAIKAYGTGVGGPPLLNGYTRLHRELELRLAALKGAEEALIFSSGYGANVGLVTGLMNPGDLVFYDALSHASFCDGMKMAGLVPRRFHHNDLNHLRRLLAAAPGDAAHDRYVGVEGVYSMDGDVAPLPALITMCRAEGALLILDDAHGTGVMGATGRGTAEHLGVEGEVDITLGTFSKVFGTTGGFVAASKPVVDYLRFFARSHMFSASLSPAVIATVLAGLDVIEKEPERIRALHRNVAAVVAGLRALGIDVASESGIIPLRVPDGMNVRRAAGRFHELGIFVNSVEYPAVPVAQQRFRVSMMATHTQADIDRLLEAVETVWSEWRDEHERAA